MEPNLDMPKSRVAATPPPARPANMRTTVEEILLRRRRGEVPDRRVRPKAYPPPRHPHGVLSRLFERPALAALGAYSLWMVGWAYYFWSLSSDG
jgi:hypothetical protein